MKCIDLRNQSNKDCKRRCYNNKNRKIKDCNKNKYYTNSNNFKTKMKIKISNMINIMKTRINMLSRSLKTQKILLIKILMQNIIFLTELLEINSINFKIKSNITKIITMIWCKNKIHSIKMKCQMNKIYSTQSLITIKMNNMLQSSSRKNSIHILNDNLKMNRCII